MIIAFLPETEAVYSW